MTLQKRSTRIFAVRSSLHVGFIKCAINTKPKREILSNHDEKAQTRTQYLYECAYACAHLYVCMYVHIYGSYKRNRWCESTFVFVKAKIHTNKHTLLLDTYVCIPLGVHSIELMLSQQLVDVFFFFFNLNR